METKIIDGQFVSNKTAVRIGIVVVILLSVLCLGLLFLIGPLVIICIGPMIVQWSYVIYANHTLKYQELTITNIRVHGKIKGKEIDLPFDKISHVELSGKRGITITTASGTIGCSNCVNREAVYSAINNVLENRTAYQMGIHGRAKDKEHKEAACSSDFVAELRKYKELLDSQLITQEESDTKKKQLLDS